MENKTSKAAGEAARILVELMQTEQMYSMHFEFDISVDEAPKIKYTVKRFAVDREEGGE